MEADTLSVFCHKEDILCIICKLHFDQLICLRLPLSVQQAAEKHARELGFESFRWYDTQNVITSHCGPGSFAVAFPGIRK